MIGENEITVTYDHDTDEYRVPGGAVEFPPSVMVPLVVSQVEGVALSALDSLASVVDPEALDDIYTRGADQVVSFLFNGYRVTIGEDRGIRLGRATRARPFR